MDLIIRLRQKRITDAEFMAYVDESLKKIDADTEARDQARLMFYQYVFRYFRLTSLIEDPEISDIHCIAYNKIRIKKKIPMRNRCYLKSNRMQQFLTNLMLKTFGVSNILKSITNYSYNRKTQRLE